ncbi:hypothetical protein M378DRAFT_174398 [Amanita muscaria Koide BX008]|uniref:Uncharacterized protein n=1 Tax=Amanita muscaria (strain Koide BX008) TaxID=946122 RepID=A0A0C2SJU3_AMAMK|nr:hypothetical protein M378DRAFT_174398 [Amanita muscaria Koide BX008]
MTNGLHVALRASLLHNDVHPARVRIGLQKLYGSLTRILQAAQACPYYSRTAKPTGQHPHVGLMCRDLLAASVNSYDTSRVSLLPRRGHKGIRLLEIARERRLPRSCSKEMIIPRTHLMH